MSLELLFLSLLSAGFLDDQLKNVRVRDAKAHVDAALKAELLEKGFSYPPKRLLLRALKKDKRFEVWAEKGGKLELFKGYAICASSGGLGPKVRVGDMQVPEGIYTISQLNPNSNYHVSLRVDYPNAVDRARSNAIFGRVPKASEYGGDIYVHGDCVTIGCMPLTDAIAEEVYWLTALAMSTGQTVPIHVFPARLDASGLDDLLALKPDAHTAQLWRDLAPIYQRFEADHAIPKIRTKGDRYLLN